MDKRGVDWQLVLAEGLISLIFALGLATSGSTLAYLMLTSLNDEYTGSLFGLSYLDAAPRLAAVIYVLFFVIALLSLTRLRVRRQAASRPRLHWCIAFLLYGLIGLWPGLVYWLLFTAADRPGI